MSDHTSARQFRESEGVQNWRVLSEGACAFFRTGSFAASTRPVAAIGELSGLDDHHPDIEADTAAVQSLLD